MGRIAGWIDGMVGAVAPVSALKRHAARAAMQRSLMYAAAKSTRLTGDWSPADGSVNAVIGASSANVRARVRQLVRDMPYFARAVDVVTDYTVGEGITFQSRVKGADGKRDKLTIQKIESAARRWMDEADIAGKLHYYEMMQLAKRQDLELGEFMIVKVRPKNMRRRRFPFALQMIEADWLSSMVNTAPVFAPSGQVLIDQGIEYHYPTGEVLAYHLADPWGFGRSMRIEAEDVVHGFKTLRPGQLRGISPFAPGVLMANDLDDLMTAELDASKAAARYLAFVKTPDPMMRQAGVGAYTDASGTDASGKKIEDLEHAVLEYLRPGEEVTFAKSDRPGVNFPPFVRLVLTMFAIVSGAPYELVSGDYQGLNFSTAKINRNDFANFLRPVARRHIRHFGMRTVSAWMQAAHASGTLELPGFLADPDRYLESRWQPPGMEPVDPLREVKSNIDEMSVLLRAPQEITEGRGRDYEEVLDDIAEAKQLAADRGLALVLEKPSTATGSNPDKIDKQKSSQDLAAMLLDKLAEDRMLLEGHA